MFTHCVDSCHTIPAGKNSSSDAGCLVVRGNILLYDNVDDELGML